MFPWVEDLDLTGLAGREFRLPRAVVPVDRMRRGLRRRVGKASIHVGCRGLFGAGGFLDGAGFVLRLRFDGVLGGVFL
ncbi:MAG TPA: hypothetical protein PKM60_11105, partial [Zoogloea sp.]|nr:hypothetical protein [Zoogloea sp.]HQE39825.1 hypothetical protein [Zoogloea sp.]